MHRSCALFRFFGIGQFDQINLIRRISICHCQTRNRAFCCGHRISHKGQQFDHWGRIIDAHICRVKSANCVLCRNVICGPRRAIIRCLDQGKVIPIWAIKFQALFPKTIGWGCVARTNRMQTFTPKRNAAHWNAKGCCAHFARATASAGNVWKWKIRQNTACISNLIPVIQVIYLGVVEIHGRLNSAQAQTFGKECIIFGCR